MKCASEVSWRLSVLIYPVLSAMSALVWDFAKRAGCISIFMRV